MEMKVRLAAKADTPCAPCQPPAGTYGVLNGFRVQPNPMISLDAPRHSAGKVYVKA